MITQLTIQNFGLIDRLPIEFCKSLNVFTGETGAGKTILIDALRYVLGEKLHTGQIRDKSKPCIIEAVFELTNKQLKESKVFSEYIEDDDSLLIINRSFSPEGKSRNKINGFTVTVSQLKELGNHLVDLHGPHDHQMLLSEDSHLNILDRLCSLDKEKSDFSKEYSTYHNLQKKLKDLQDLSLNRERELDMLSHQMKELEQVSLEKASYENIVNESTRINNSEKLYDCVRQLIDILENEQTGISAAASKAFGFMNTLVKIDESTEEIAGVLSRIQDDSSELVSYLNSYIENLSFEPGKAEEINRRYDIYSDILRKYGPSLQEVQDFYSKTKEKYSLIVDLEHNNSDLKTQIKASEKGLNQVAKKISEKRKTAALSLKKTIENELKELGIKHVLFDCRVEKDNITKTGTDKVSFYISPNAGEELKPLAEIISSGEAARMMLALKKALTKVDPIPVLVFDEIDAQIGGRLGTITGQKLKSLADDRQVILITHLPQIASFGDYHFKVTKEVEKNRTTTDVYLLDPVARIKELAQMMSGEEETDIAIKHAAELLSKAN